ncbi:potassium channel family protein [uncultured Cetobacterium sp.]|uniref:potassium channel family protein n=1 Tax=uncultured Cetobacterium sp. TaxID=527638 RepID=UPI002615FBA6|nr:potassium channel family protein [uncultured Cetobacterium sp.]
MLDYRKYLGNLIKQIKNIKSLSSLKKTQIRTFSILLSIFFAGWELYSSDIIRSSKEFIFSSVVLIFSIFVILYPFIYFFRFKFGKFLSEHVLFSISLILYFILLIPILGLINNLFLDVSLSGFTIKILHIISILVSMSLIVIIISKQFIMLIYKKRKIVGVDILTTFLTYITLGLAFGSLYYILNFMVKTNLFLGVEKPSNFNLGNFLNHIYISLGSLSTVGSGSISPLNPYIRIICVFETILGIFLTSFSLGFIFSVLGPNNQEISTEDTQIENKVDESLVSNSIKKSFTKLKLDLSLVEQLTSWK